MKNLYNKSERNYVHTVTEADGKFTTYRLKPKSKLNVPDEVAKIWLMSSEIMEVGSTEDDKDKEIARLKAELAKTKGNEEVVPMTLDELRARAKELKIKGYAVMKKETLEKKIAEKEQLLASE